MQRFVLTLIGLTAGFLAAAANAQTAATPAGDAAIPFATVAEALAALKARDGDSVTVMTADGWVTVDEPSAAARWSFTPSGYYAYPALIKRVIKRSPGGAAEVETSSLCESDKASCDKLLAEFHVLDERIRQAIQARGRRTPAAPQMPAVPQTPAAPPPQPASGAAPA